MSKLKSRNAKIHSCEKERCAIKPNSKDKETKKKKTNNYNQPSTSTTITTMIIEVKTKTKSSELLERNEIENKKKSITKVKLKCVRCSAQRHFSVEKYAHSRMWQVIHIGFWVTLCHIKYSYTLALMVSGTLRKYIYSARPNRKMTDSWLSTMSNGKGETTQLLNCFGVFLIFFCMQWHKLTFSALWWFGKFSAFFFLNLINMRPKFKKTGCN